MSARSRSHEAEWSGLDVSLEPVRRSLLHDAAREAEWIRADAREAADERIAEAEREADEELGRAAEHGRAVADARTAAEVAREAERAHRRVLVAQRRIHERLVAEARAAAVGLRADPRYPDLLDRLMELAHAQLGHDAEIHHDDEVGGLVAVDGRGRRVDYRLPELAERALAELAEDVSEVWR